MVQLNNQRKLSQRRKMINHTEFKAELEGSDNLNNLFDESIKDKIDWKSTYKLLNNQDKYIKSTSTSRDTQIRSFRYKNMMKKYDEYANDK